MIEYGFARFPRVVGNPGQIMIYDFNQFLQFFKINNGVKPLFVSTNSYYAIDKYGNPSKVFLERIFLDLDTDTGGTIKDAHKDTIKVAKYCQKHKIPFITSFSGNGFHMHLLLKPEERSLDVWLSQAIKAVQYMMKKELNLQTLNTVCAEPKRLVRLPFSKYVNKSQGSHNWTINRNYCIPLTLNQLLSYNIEDIIELSNKPVLEDSYKVEGSKTTLKQLLKDYKVDARTFKNIPLNGIKTTIDCTKFNSQDIYEMTKLMIPLPCIAKHLWTHNPSHVIRFSACSFLKSVLTREEAHTFFDVLSFESEWNDKDNKAYRTYQIDNIYNQDYNRPYSCEELIRMGYCIGEKCKRYKDKIAELELKEQQ